METIKQIKIPVTADYVLSPDFVYGKDTGIYFRTHTDNYGRITFENLDAVKICRGEIMPYEFDYSSADQYTWIFVIENSRWLKERFRYEKKHYGSAYEFGGDVYEMMTDFKHYLFSFHDQFIEVIARGFWFEEAEESLFQKDLTQGHPFLPLPESGEYLTVQSITSQIRSNPQPKEQLIYSAQFCSQKLYEFTLELNGKTYAAYTVFISYRNGKLISILRSFLGRQEMTYEGFVDLEQVKPYVEAYLEKIYHQRNKREE